MGNTMTTINSNSDLLSIRLRRRMQNSKVLKHSLQETGYIDLISLVLPIMFHDNETISSNNAVVSSFNY
jgi:hypothetical protein